MKMTCFESRQSLSITAAYYLMTHSASLCLSIFGEVLSVLKN